MEKSGQKANWEKAATLKIHPPTVATGIRSDELDEVIVINLFISKYSLSKATVMYR